MVSKVYSAGVCGIEGFEVTVECDIQNRMSVYEIVGLPDTAVKEAKERVRAACENSGFSFPDTSVILNLAPADRRKEGAGFDLAMLVAVLKTAGHLCEVDDTMCFLGELSLSGEVRATEGVLCRVLAARDAGKKSAFVPFENAEEAACVDGINIYGIRSVSELVAHINGIAPVKPSVFDFASYKKETDEIDFDFSDIRGQAKACRAMEVAAAGGHNLLLIGSPGVGKSMIAKRMPGILPDISFAEALETTKIYSAAGMLPPHSSLVSKRPFRSPHHTSTAAAMAGGGSHNITPGEVSLSHNGVLFLDELPEYSKQVTEILRQPIEDGQITITRASAKVTYPCSFTLICAMNPCKCGYFGHPTKACTCSTESRIKYMSRISGPLLDRIDLQVEMRTMTYKEISERKPGEPSAVIRARVNRARDFSRRRFEKYGFNISCNAQMTPAMIRVCCELDEEAEALFKEAFDKLSLSPRAHDRILRVARTIADLNERENIQSSDIAETLALRNLDKSYFNPARM